MKASKKDYMAKYRVEHKEELRAYCASYHVEHCEEIAVRKAKRHKDKAPHLMWKYGITLADYDMMLEIQGGVCAICGKTPEENKRRLCVDHDHETGQVRGILCTQCNSVLGFWKDNPETARQAMIYLRRYGK